MEKRNILKLQILGLLVVLVILVSSFYVTYNDEKKQSLRGEAKFQLSYRYRMTNTGPLNLTSVNLRLAIMKSWAPVQTVESVQIMTPPNRTTTDEYENSFAWYEFEDFQVGQSLDLEFKVNMTLNLLDFTGVNLPILPYDINSPEYKLFTVYDPLTDTTDPGVQSVAKQLTPSSNILDIAYNAYNFSSTYIKYRLLAESKGASFAIRNAYGDCDEYSNLFIALVRARGIPAIDHTAWLFDSELSDGFTTTDEGAAAHAYPMFYLQGFGLLPVDPTRGNVKLFENFLKTDEKRITMTRGPNEPYRLLKYRWIPVEGMNDPLIQSNYTIFIKKIDINYFSTLRKILVVLLVAIPVIFIVFNSIRGRYAVKQHNEMRERLLSPTKQAELKE